MDFAFHTLPWALLVAVSACGADDTGIETGCYGQGCPDSGTQPDSTVAPCPSGTVLVGYNSCVSELTGQTPVGTVTPATWAAAEQACASTAGSGSLIVTTPCNEMVSYQAAVTVHAVEVPEIVVYDATSGEPVAVIGPPALGTPGYTYFSGEATITAACFIALSAGTSCSSFDAAAPDDASD
jgi:hypothetical protein